MTAGSRKREVFANPFFVVMMAASVAFVLTVLAYLVSASVLEPGALGGNESSSLPKHARTASSLATAAWLDRNAPWVLAVELGVMLITGVVAVATDRWFSPRPKPKPPA
jgi:hypothetical protein